MNIPEGLNTMTVQAPQPDLWIVRFNRPEVMNAINTATAQDLCRIFGPMVHASGELRCVILTGTGERAFSSGGDLKERNDMTDEAWHDQHAIIDESRLALLNSSVPVIAAVNGIAYGGGCELALCCDFIHASSNARFALPEVMRGILPGGGGTQTLPRAVGERRAKEIILTGAPFTAQEAQAWGMVNAVREPSVLMPHVLDVARAICRNAPISVRQAKKAIHAGLQVDIVTGLQMEVQAYERTVPTQDRREGIAAFNEKRPPNFKGR
ncbi:MAG TPA: enoyl-CoA hydratase-related protein [Xanthobacteraceae bacterium]|nr:enoyl-CoA hydratase-related protein [Xanthobacteraceae bacterium]